MNSDALGVSPLGVAIAKKQLMESSRDAVEREKLVQKKNNKHNKENKHKQIVTTSWTKKDDKKRRQKNKNPSWVSLVEGVTLYGLCLIVPTILGILMRVEWSQVQTYIEDEIVCPYSSFLCWHVFGKVLPDPEPELTFTNFASETYLSDIYVILGLTLTMACFRVLLVHWLVPNNLAPRQMEALVRCKSIHLLSSDYKQSLTPRETPRAVISWESLKKETPGLKEKLSLPMVPDWEKSDTDNIHEGNIKNNNNDNISSVDSAEEGATILPRSGDSAADLGLAIDSNTPTDRGRPIIGLEAFQGGGFLEACSPMPGSLRNADDDDNSQQLYHIDDDDDDAVGQTRGQAVTPPLDPRDLEEHEQEEEETASMWKRRGSAASLAAAAAAAVQEENHHVEHDDPFEVVEGTDAGSPASSSSSSSPPSSPQRLFAAPRYATAVFRLLYCTLSCTMAWYLFRDADFWPPYVGGHGSTARCWDLSGSLSLAKSLDSDFDHRNTVLRRFFLVQASYHLHSGAFHVASVVLLHLLKKGHPENFTSSPPSNERKTLSLMRSLIQPRALLQHSLSLVWLSVSYIFSSLRRLGAIGMFAFDMSSWALHLLQSCLNAPKESVLAKPKVIRAVWLFLVCPSFLYFRFWVWPLVGYSALVESERWLAQLESTLVPGSAVWFRTTFQVWMTLWMGFHAVHFKRLVFHPHIQRIMTSKEVTTSSQAATPR